MGLRYYIAAWSLETAPEEAASQLLKVAQSNSAFAKEPATYQLLGLAYYNGEFKKLADEYKRLYEGKEETPESKALFDRINVVLDRIIDAYARAVALSNGKPQYTALNTSAKNALTTFYKQRHENETGLNELIANVLSRPLPIPGQEPAPTSVPSSSSGANSATGAAVTTTQPATGAQPAARDAAKPAPTTTTTPNPGAKPATPPQKPPVSKAAPVAKGSKAARG